MHVGFVFAAKQQRRELIFTSHAFLQYKSIYCSALQRTFSKAWSLKFVSVLTMSAVVVEWREGRQKGVQHEIPSRCVLGGVANLSGGEDVSVKMGKSSAAKVWKAQFIRFVESTAPEPDQSSKEQPRKEGKRRSHTSQECKQKKKAGKVSFYDRCVSLLYIYCI